MINLQICCRWLNLSWRFERSMEGQHHPSKWKKGPSGASLWISIKHRVRGVSTSPPCQLWLEPDRSPCENRDHYGPKESWEAGGGSITLLRPHWCTAKISYPSSVFHNAAGWRFIGSQMLFWTLPIARYHWSRSKECIMVLTFLFIKKNIHIVLTEGGKNLCFI